MDMNQLAKLLIPHNILLLLLAFTLLDLVMLLVVLNSLVLLLALVLYHLVLKLALPLHLMAWVGQILLGKGILT